MCNRAILKNVRMLISVPNRYKTQEICEKAVDNYIFVVVSDPYKTQEMCIRAVSTCSFVFDSIPNQCKTQDMCIRAVDDNPSTIKWTVKLLMIILMH